MLHFYVLYYIGIFTQLSQQKRCLKMLSSFALEHNKLQVTYLNISEKQWCKEFKGNVGWFDIEWWEQQGQQYCDGL